MVILLGIDSCLLIIVSSYTFRQWMSYIIFLRSLGNRDKIHHVITWKTTTITIIICIFNLYSLIFPIPTTYSVRRFYFWNKAIGI